MVQVHTRLAAVVALLLVGAALAGCVGSSSQPSPSSDDSTTSEGDSTETTSSNQTQKPENTTEESPAAAEEEVEGTQSRTFSNSTTVNVSTGVWWYSFNEPTCDPNSNRTVPCGFHSASWTLFQNPPDDFTAIRVELTWETQTKGTPLGAADAAITGGTTNQTSAQSDPVQFWVLPKDYKSGKLRTYAQSEGPAGAWFQAKVTATTTVFWNGPPPSWGYSALG